jgi:hypothetical protein
MSSMQEQAAARGRAWLLHGALLAASACIMQPA